MDTIDRALSLVAEFCCSGKLEDNVNAVKNLLSNDVVLNPRHVNLFGLNNLCKFIGENEKEVAAFETQAYYKRELYPPSLFAKYNSSINVTRLGSYPSDLSSSLISSLDTAASNEPVIEAENAPKIETLGKTIKDMAISGPKHSIAFPGKTKTSPQQHQRVPRATKNTVISTLTKDTRKELYELVECEDLDNFTVELLCRAKVSLADLLEAGVSMPDMKILFELKSIDDLKRIKFKPRDLVSHRKLFSVNHAVMFFGITYNLLVSQFDFKLTDALLLKMTAAELTTLGFNLDVALESVNEETGRPYFSKDALFMFNFDYQSWRDLLGLRSDICDIMQITKEDVTKYWKESATVAITQMRLKSAKEYLNNGM